MRRPPSDAAFGFAERHTVLHRRTESVTGRTPVSSAANWVPFETPGGRIAKVWLNDEDEAAVDIFLITAVEENSRNGKGKRPRRRGRS